MAQQITLQIETEDAAWLDTFANNFVNQNGQLFITYLGADQRGGFEKLANATQQDKNEFTLAVIGRRMLEQSQALEEERILGEARAQMLETRAKLPDLRKK